MQKLLIKLNLKKYFNELFYKKCKKKSFIYFKKIQ